jgi:hypothetical protein
VVGVVPGLVGTLQALEVIKLLVGYVACLRVFMRGRVLPQCVGVQSAANHELCHYIDGVTQH